MHKIQPREKRICWEDRFMLEALLAAQRSPDPNTQVGACIVNSHQRILSSGHNSFPNGICSHSFPWEREAVSPLDTKYPYIVHAEKNAIFNANVPLDNCTLFVTMFPCCECAKDIIQARINKIVYLTNPYKDLWQTKAAELMFQAIDLPVILHKWADKQAVLSCLQQITSFLEK